MSSPCQVGLFRKSGVKSRIQYLRDLVESDPGGVSYEGHSAFDIADMVKQYFRDLPEPVFTSKLCETFLHIYQCEQAFIRLRGRLRFPFEITQPQDRLWLLPSRFSQRSAAGGGPGGHLAAP